MNQSPKQQQIGVITTVLAPIFVVTILPDDLPFIHSLLWAVGIGLAVGLTGLFIMRMMSADKEDS